MLTFSAKVAYAVQLLRALKRRDRQAAPAPLQALAGELRLPYRYLAQIARRLRRAGLLQSFEGVNGGYRLAMTPAAINLDAIITALEPRRPFTRCLGVKRSGQCPCGGGCGTQAWWQSVEARLKRELQHLTLAQLR